MASAFLDIVTRLYATTDECDVDTTSNTYTPEAAQLEEPSLISERCRGDQTEETLPDDMERREKELLEKLKVKMKEFDEISEAADHVSTTLQKVREQMVCTLCRQMLQDPQLLQCGHSACYPCLRKLWTRPSAEYGDAPIIDADTESDPDEKTAAGGESNLADLAFAPAPGPSRCHRFTSAVNSQKFCPDCNAVVTHRPIPAYHLRAIIETLNGDFPPYPPNI